MTKAVMVPENIHKRLQVDESKAIYPITSLKFDIRGSKSPIHRYDYFYFRKDISSAFLLNSSGAGISEM